jgi:hypothetical protein
LWIIDSVVEELLMGVEIVCCAFLATFGWKIWDACAEADAFDEMAGGA